MKLIDLLVQELPKRGGWPEGAVEAGFLCSNTTLYFVDANGDCPSEWRIEMDSEVKDNDIEISKDQYESALAESQKSAWNGEAMPPVGAKVEFFINAKLGYWNNWIPDVGTEMEVVAHKTTTDGNNVAVCYWDERGAGRACCFVPESIKPFRTEAERKHEAVLESICAVLEMVAQDYKREDEAKLIYEAIAAGKIPGVKLED